MEYLDFELPLKELEDQLEKCNEIRNESKVDVKDTYKNLKAKIEQTKKDSSNFEKNAVPMFRCFKLFSFC